MKTKLLLYTKLLLHTETHTKLFFFKFYRVWKKILHREDSFDFFPQIKKCILTFSHTSTQIFCFPPHLVGRKTWRRILLFWTGAPPNAPAQADKGFPDEFQQTEEKCSKLLNTVFSTSQVIIIIVFFFLECLRFDNCNYYTYSVPWTFLKTKPPSDFW